MICQSCHHRPSCRTAEHGAACYCPCHDAADAAPDLLVALWNIVRGADLYSAGNEESRFVEILATDIEGARAAIAKAEKEIA